MVNVKFQYEQFAANFYHLPTCRDDTNRFQTEKSFKLFAVANR